jgi:hypothetical protein
MSDQRKPRAVVWISDVYPRINLLLVAVLVPLFLFDGIGIIRRQRILAEGKSVTATIVDVSSRPHSSMWAEFEYSSGGVRRGAHTDILGFRSCQIRVGQSVAVHYLAEDATLDDDLGMTPWRLLETVALWVGLAVWAFQRGPIRARRPAAEVKGEWHRK